MSCTTKGYFPLWRKINNNSLIFQRIVQKIRKKIRNIEYKKRVFCDIQMIVTILALY